MRNIINRTRGKLYAGRTAIVQNASIEPDERYPGCVSHLYMHETISSPDLKLFNRQRKPLMSMREPIAQRNANDGAHDRTRVIHRRARNRQERRER